MDIRELLIRLICLVSSLSLSCLADLVEGNVTCIQAVTHFESLPPTVEVVILVHPFNKVNVLPHLFGGFDIQSYPKDRINIHIRTDELVLKSIEPKLKALNQLTIEILEQWVRSNSGQYNRVELDKIPLTEEDDKANQETEYWSRKRFSRIIHAKELALERARKHWTDLVLFMDADVILVNPDTLKSVINAEFEKSILFSPMLYSLGTYSNFWAGMTDTGYYKRTDDYLPILERQRLGSFDVPMIHSCLFINLRSQVSRNITFVPKENHPFDDIISFALSAKELGIPLRVNNKEIWGYIAPPVENSELSQDIIDLELESLVEGARLPVAKSLGQYVAGTEKDKLGVDNVYVINLLRRPERLERMRKNLDVIGIDAQIWPAIDGNDLREEGLRNLGVKAMPKYKDPYHDRPMTFGEIGCFLSHYYIWKDIVSRNLSKAIILEDDVRFERNMKKRFVEAIDGINLAEVDFVYIGRKKQSSEKETRVTIHFVKPNYSYWTIGYLITSRGAEKLIKSKPLESLVPVDEYLPIMYNEHPNVTWKNYYRVRNLVALSFDPVLIAPTHYVGDDLYVSDTEASDNILSNLNNPRHTEL